VIVNNILALDHEDAFVLKDPARLFESAFIVLSEFIVCPVPGKAP
jgi:hypothetical protein